jgi:gamma-glutamyltranspeptidase/glutathione hydrolase
MHMSSIRAPHGMVATVDQLASSAGVAMLRAGGSAADAAIAANAVLAVTAPHMCGLGGDLFALVHQGAGAPVALNASGRAGSGADPDRLRADGHTAMPMLGDVRSAPVPGCVDGWLALHERFGRLPLAQLFAPAIGYASDGWPASILLAGTVAVLHGVEGAGVLAEGGMRSGARITRPGVAAALEAIASHGRDGFYGGAFGKGLLAVGGGEYTEADLESALADWVEPLCLRVWGHDVWTTPPNSQGYLTLLGAAIAEGLSLPDDPRDPLWAHLLIESARAGAHDRGDTLWEHADVAPMLESDAVAERRALIDPKHRATLRGPVGAGDTMYLCAVDDEGTGVSLIQSNARGYGSHVFEPSTGIGLHNRGIGFSLEPGHPAEYGPGRRPPHTLAPALVTRPDGSLRAVIGTMGGDAQPQVLLQLLTRLLHHGAGASAAISAPRWSLTGPTTPDFSTWSDPDGAVVELEADAASDWAPGLVERGHDVKVVDELSGIFGHAHVITVEPDGMLAGAADPRALIGAAEGY